MSFRWTTREGEVLSLAEMETRHLFNTAKMLYNHLAATYGMQLVWFRHGYGDKRVQALADPRGMVGAMLALFTEIERRKDLPDKYAEPYRLILEELRRAAGRGKLIPALVARGIQEKDPDAVLQAELDALLDPNQ